MIKQLSFFMVMIRFSCLDIKEIVSKLFSNLILTIYKGRMKVKSSLIYLKN
jgi:hypothetical protein